MKNAFTILVILLGLTFSVSPLFGHCQIPCGIYADDVVFGELMTDVQTIEKSMKEIKSLSEDLSSNPHQLVRWVTNKEAHAQKIQETMSAYFLAQRIKLEMKDDNPEDYAKLIELSHKITVLAMQCKQGTDLDHASKLHDALNEFQKAYQQ